MTDDFCEAPGCSEQGTLMGGLCAAHTLQHISKHPANAHQPATVYACATCQITHTHYDTAYLHCAPAVITETTLQGTRHRCSTCTKIHATPYAARICCHPEPRMLTPCTRCGSLYYIDSHAACPRCAAKTS